MKFKPQCHDYHSEATLLWSERHPVLAKQLSRIHISAQHLDKEEEFEVENDHDEVAKEQESSLAASLPHPSSSFLDTTNQSNGSTPLIATTYRIHAQKSKSTSKNLDELCNVSSRRRRRKRRRDPSESLSVSYLHPRPRLEIPTRDKFDSLIFLHDCILAAIFYDKFVLRPSLAQCKSQPEPAYKDQAAEDNILEMEVLESPEAEKHSVHRTNSHSLYDENGSNSRKKSWRQNDRKQASSAASSQPPLDMRDRFLDATNNISCFETPAMSPNSQPHLPHKTMDLGGPSPPPAMDAFKINRSSDTPVVAPPRPQLQNERMECEEVVPSTDATFQAQAEEQKKQLSIETIPQRVTDGISTPCIHLPPHSQEQSCNMRLRRRQRRIARAISGSIMGSKGIIVLSPKHFSIYDSPLLVELWTDIRRTANRARIANGEWWSETSKDSSAISLTMAATERRSSIWRHPHPSRHLQNAISFWWRRRMEITFFSRFAQASSIGAIANLERLVCLFFLRHLLSPCEGKRNVTLRTLEVPKKVASPKKKKILEAPYRYCLLDILQGNAGTFSNVSVGSPGDRRETRKRELKAIVPSALFRPRNLILEIMQQRIQFAIALAWNVARQQQQQQQGDQCQQTQQQKRHLEPDGNSDTESNCDANLDTAFESKHTFSEKRESLDSPAGRPTKRSKESRIPCEDGKSKISDARHSLRDSHWDDPRLPMTRYSDQQERRLQMASSTISKSDAQESEEQQPNRAEARRTELSLLERFGLAPNRPQTEESVSKFTHTNGKRRLQSSMTPDNEDTRESKRSRRQTRQAASDAGEIETTSSQIQRDSLAPFFDFGCDEIPVDKVVGASSTPNPDSLREQEQSAFDPKLKQSSPRKTIIEVVSVPKLDDKSEHYRNWQPMDFGLDSGTVCSFNSEKEDSCTSGAYNGRKFDSTSGGLNASELSIENSPLKIATSTHPRPPPPTKNRVCSEREKKKRARKVAKKEKKLKRKKEKRRQKKKSQKMQTDPKTLSEGPTQDLDDEDVIVLDPPHLSSETARATNQEVPRSATKLMGFGSPNQPIVIDYGDNDASTQQDSPAATSHQDTRPPLLLLCSEHFLEVWGDTAAQLVSGDWRSKVASQHAARKCQGQRFRFLDTNLVDSCGVDIELPNRGGVILSALSSWQSGDGFDGLMKRIVGLISTTRFRFLYVFVCADIDQDERMMDNMARMQNVALHQYDDFGTSTSFTLISPHALAASIGQSISHLDASLELEEVQACIDDDRTFERLLFLLRLIPTLTVTSVLHCFLSCPAANDFPGDNSCRWFHNLFKDGKERKRMQRMDSNQLHPAVTTQLTFALGTKIGDDSVFQS